MLTKKKKNINKSTDLNNIRKMTVAYLQLFNNKKKWPNDLFLFIFFLSLTDFIIINIYNKMNNNKK